MSKSDTFDLSADSGKLLPSEVAFFIFFECLGGAKSVDKQRVTPKNHNNIDS